ncbi:MAG: preprotein translocase subunit SecA, partial [Dehalococcoidia bacterium]|nr:preprotein translocase subunit SecA [Dehalococcoidia bacterium]
MFKKLTGFIGDSNEREIKRCKPLVDKINALEPDIKKLSDEELRARIAGHRSRIEDAGSEDAEDKLLDNLLPEVFAVVRESAWRRIGQRHFDVQLIGGIVLHEGKIAEMKTGEGKTLVATLAVSLNSLSGRGVHVVTVNDYLAKRDTQWMGPIYHGVGISVGCIQHDGAFIFDPEYEAEDVRLQHLRPVGRTEAYRADVTYGTNSEFGFDHLRDNMVVDLSRCVQRDLNYAIVDEVDNILIDEARTPLIISGAPEESAREYYTMARLVPRLRPQEDYQVEERTRSIYLTEGGIAKMERWLGIGNLYEDSSSRIPHFIDNALKAHVLYQRDREYVVTPDKETQELSVVIVDEFTGRLMFGRRYSEGLHQAIEAKESMNYKGLRVKEETKTLASITYQNYFRMYGKLAGMTGTAATEAEEFDKIYKLEVVSIPTNKPMIRLEHNDLIYKTEEGKVRAVVNEIEQHHKDGRPVLVGTVSIENSERLSQMLLRRGIQHEVLNAKPDKVEREATIIAQGGRTGAVTIATNMAGRGVDIILGGKPDGRDTSDWQTEHEKVVALGGLHVIGTERHEARRIDNQLRGRAGRQGDPGSSRFYVSLEDDLMKRFGGDRVKSVMNWVGFDEDTPLEHGMVGKVIENSQSKVEAYHFDIRKHLVEYDDVLDTQRKVIYGERKKILGGADLKANIQEMVHSAITEVIRTNLRDEHGDDWDIDGFIGGAGRILPLP